MDSVELNIYEPPRFFEAFLRGRAYTEPPDITARVCGICPVAYQVSACNAIEDACGVTVDPELVALRRLLYCGEWIHSHALHIYLLHAPDFLGYPDGISLARDRPEFIERGPALKKAGNRLMEHDRRTGDPPRQRAAGRVLLGPARERSQAAGRAAAPRARRRRSHRTLGRRIRLSRLSDSTTSSWR